MSGTEFFLGRQPIVGRERELVAYELLFRSSTLNAANVMDDVAASATVIQYAFSDLGLRQVLEDKTGFINLPEALLMSDVISMLPKANIVLEVLERVQVSPELVARCAQLHADGHRLALDDVTELTEKQLQLLPLVEYVKVDLMAMPRAKVPALVARLRNLGVKNLLAEKVETPEEFAFCLELGFELFQGYFFAKPVILSGRSVQPSVLVLLKLLGLLVADAEIGVLEHALKQAPDLTLRLLKLANSAAFCRNKKISTVREAILLLGRAQLSRLVQVMVFAQQSGVPPGQDPILQTAAVRGRLMEGLAGALGCTSLREPAFMAGMLSLADVLFGQNLADILPALNLEDRLRAALLERDGQLGALLNLVEAAEREDGEAALRLMQGLELQDLNVFNRLQVEAMQWAAAI